MKYPIFLLAGLALAVMVLLAQRGAGPPLEAHTFPVAIDLPDGWLPEGIETGDGPTLLAGSRRHGAIYAANPLTGEGRVLVQPQAGRIAVGLDFDHRTNYIFVAGGPGGAGYVYSADDGGAVQEFAFTGAPTFINDVIVTPHGAYFTDSMKPVLFKVPLGSGGELPAGGAFETIWLAGDYQHQAGFNLNGIEATENGDSLIVVQSGTGRLLRVDPASGVATNIDIGSYSVTAGDGILLDGRTLYVVRNNLNMIAVIQFSPDLRSGALVKEISQANLIAPARFDVPTTVTLYDGSLYAVNARFAAGMDPGLKYTIVRVEP